VHRDDRSGIPDHDRNDPLDQLLHNAYWPEPEKERLDRLWHQWVTRRSVRTVRTWIPMAAAAALLLAVFGGLLGRRYANQRRLVESTPGPVETATMDHDLEPVESRAATAYETIIMLVAERRRAPVEQSENVTREPHPIEQAVGQLIDNPDAEPHAIIESMRTNADWTSDRLEADLAQFIRGQAGPRQLAAVRLLGCVATRRSLALLHELSSIPACRAAAVPGLAHLVDPFTVARLAAEENDIKLKRDLLAELIQRDGPTAVTLFLNFVVDRRSLEVAMEAVDLVSVAPTETLFQMLESSNYPLRIAAARVLGRLDRPVIAQRLAGMVLRDTNRREALIALLSCPNQGAAQFLALAQRDTTLASNIRAARFQLQALQ